MATVSVVVVVVGKETATLQSLRDWVGKRASTALGAAVGTKGQVDFFLFALVRFAVSMLQAASFYIALMVLRLKIITS
jgi:DNA mismatch repair protein MutH